ncbi:MAG: TatD family hydrolase [Actinomycetota bacterium]|nr:TatD family hydrolase [Actinomycetota bacterium]
MTDTTSARLTWVDTHGHLFLMDEPADVVLTRAQNAGVNWLVCPGVDTATTRASEAIALQYPGVVLWSAGLHPHDASNWDVEQEALSDLAKTADAVGECGLDYYRELSPRRDQKKAFGDQLELASALGKPVIVHCRDAFADVHDMVGRAELGADVILHCWTGGPKWTKRFAELGVTFSFAGPLTYTTAETLRLGAAEAPPERTMVETDSPYLTPEPLRGQNNEPANVYLTGKGLAGVWGVSVEDVSVSTTACAERVFRRA